MCIIKRLIPGKTLDGVFCYEWVDCSCILHLERALNNNRWLNVLTLLKIKKPNPKEKQLFTFGFEKE
jgi:hypothetical protein